jgi:hypothetical protein
LFRRPARPSFTRSRTAAFPPSRARLLKRTASRRPRPPIKAGGSRPSPRPTARSHPRGPFAFPRFPIGPRCPGRSRRAPEQDARPQFGNSRSGYASRVRGAMPCRPTSPADGLHLVQAREALKAHTTNFRIARRSLPISRAYLRTIEKAPSILLVSLLIGKADCR